MSAPRAVPAICLLVLTLAAGCVSSTKVRRFAADTPVAAPTASRTILFAGVAYKVPRGYHVGTLARGFLCENSAAIRWNQATFADTANMVARAFENEAAKAGYRVLRQESDSLFQTPAQWQADVLVAAIVKDFAFNICTAGLGTHATSSGESSIEIEWQAFDQRLRRVVATATTGGTAKTPRQPEGGGKAIYEAAAAAARNVLARDEFVAALGNNDRPRAAEPQAPLPPLVMDVLPAADDGASTPDAIENVRGSVVTVRGEEGFGSGFIVSSAGFVVTCAHVVECAERVTVKLSTGREVEGRVLRRNATADVALVQLESTGYPAAPLGVSTSLKAGSSVFAVGSPLGQQGTVTRGIVSAVRTEDGRRLIQSDVTIHAGSSGGPLLDEHGRVIAIARSGQGLFGTFGVGINEFVPIEEAWAGLHVEPRVVESAPSASPQH